MLWEECTFGSLRLRNRLVMPPMESGRADRGEITAALVEYYRQRAEGSRPGLIIVEHSCITEAGRAGPQQLSIAEDRVLDGHRRLTDAIHEAGGRTILQLSHGGSAAEPFDGGELVSASPLANPRKKLDRLPRALTATEIRDLEARYAEAAQRALRAGYDGVELHCAHGYLLDQFYSPITNRRQDEYGCGSLENRLRFLIEAMALVRSALGSAAPLAVRLGGADYLPGGATEEDAVQASVLLEAAGADLLDLSGGMCGFIRAGHPEPGYFGSMTEKIKAAVSVPVLLTGGVQTPAQAEELLLAGKADRIGVGRALFRDPRWAERQ